MTAKQTRDSEKRIHETHENYNMDYVSPLSLPVGLTKPGFKYWWVNTGIKGQENFRVEEMASKGWSLVPIERSPNKNIDPLGRNNYSNKYYTHKDLILMEREEKYSIAEEKYLNSTNQNKIKSLRGVSNDMGSFTNHSHSSIDSL